MLLVWSSGQTARELLDCVDKFQALHQAATDGLTARLLSSAPGHNINSAGVGPKDLARAKMSRDAHRAPRRKVEVQATVSTGNRFGMLDTGSDGNSTEEEDET